MKCSFNNFKLKTRNHFIALFLLLVLTCCGRNLETQYLPDPYEAGWKGQPVATIVEENDKIRVLKCVFPPGVGHEKHYHNPHTGYTLQGSKFRITDDNGTREVDVPTGSTFSRSEVTVHEVQNVGETTASFLIIEYK